MKYLSIAFLISCLFPYTQFLPLETYTQPYAFILGLILFLVRAKEVFPSLPRSDTLALTGLAFVGTLGFIINCFPSPNEQEAKYLLMYLSPLILTIALLSVLHRYPETVLKVVSVSALVWLLVGAIQTIYDPNFASSFVGVWQEAAEVVVESGRGVLSLAPEPTHHGFQLLLLGATLAVLQGKPWLIWSCVLGALFLARSSSAILALVCGAVLLVIQRPFQLARPILLLLLAAPIALAFSEGIVAENSRVLSLIYSFLEEPAALLAIDYSVNLRIGGLIASVQYSIQSFLLPHGLSHEGWLENSKEILKQFSWLMDISSAGPPSGFIIIVYQLGFFAVLLLWQPISRMLRAPIPELSKLLVLAALFVFLGQYLISAPGYSMLYACLIHRFLLSRAVGVVRRQQSPSAKRRPARQSRQGVGLPAQIPGIGPPVQAPAA